MGAHLSKDEIEKLYEYNIESSTYYTERELEILEKMNKRLSEKDCPDIEELENELIDHINEIPQFKANEEYEEYLDHINSCVRCRIKYTICSLKIQLKMAKIYKGKE